MPKGKVEPERSPDESPGPAEFWNHDHCKNHHSDHSLIASPLTLAYLAPQQYGIWMTISSMVTSLACADLGIGNGLVNAISEAHGRNDRRRPNGCVKYISHDQVPQHWRDLPHLADGVGAPTFAGGIQVARALASGNQGRRFLMVTFVTLSPLTQV